MESSCLESVGRGEKSEEGDMSGSTGKHLGRRVVGVAVGSLLAQAAWGASIDWDNETGDGKWNTPTNWSTNITPAGVDDAAFINRAAGPANITADIPLLRDFR